MTEYTFDPPITLKGNILVFTLDDAAAFVRSYKKPKWRTGQQTVLRRLESAVTEDQEKYAADSFRGWAEAEDVIAKLGA
jgi:hypothetical protein